MKKEPQIIGFRPLKDDHRVIRKLAAKLGVGQSQVLRLALRRLAELEGLTKQAS